MVRKCIGTNTKHHESEQNMSGVNKVFLLGNVGKDPEVRFTNSGKAVCNFSVATSETWVDEKTKEKKEKTEWHRVTAFAKLGELCGQYLKKGAKCFVEGSIKYSEYEKDGVKKHSTDIIAASVQFLSAPSGKVQNYGDMGVSTKPTESTEPVDADVPF